MSAAQHLLDQIQSLARIEALEAAPDAYVERLAGELGEAATLAALEARDDALRHALAQVDAMIERAARIRLEHALADAASIAAPTRKVFATTIVSYAGRIELLASRAREVAARGGAADPDEVAGWVADVAHGVLALRAAVRAGVLAQVRDRAAAAVPAADHHARDRALDDATRQRWSAARRELEALAQQPARITAAPMSARVADWPTQLDEPEPEPERTFADMIELD
jgi:hypothetical protein